MSNIKLFGFTFSGSSPDNLKSPIPKDDDSSIKVDSAPGFISPQVTSIALDNLAATENEFISKYRETSMIPEVNMCVEEIVSESIIVDKDDMNVTLDLDRVTFTDNIKNKITEEFEEVYDLLMFGRKGHDIFKKWYVDGRLNYQAIIDPDDTKQGIQALRFIDPRKIKRVREAEKEVDPKTGAITIKSYKEYFLYNERGVGSIVQ